MGQHIAERIAALLDGDRASHDHPDPHPPPLDDALEALLRRMRLLHIRRAAPRSWPPRRRSCRSRRGPAGAAHRGGRWSNRSSLATCRPGRRSTGKTFEAWNEATSSIRADPGRATHLEWIGRAENLVVCGLAGTGKTFLLEALARPRSRPDATSPGSPSKPSVSWSAATAPTTRSPRRSPGSCALIW